MEWQSDPAHRFWVYFLIVLVAAVILITIGAMHFRSGSVTSVVMLSIGCSILAALTLDTASRVIHPPQEVTIGHGNREVSISVQDRV